MYYNRGLPSLEELEQFNPDLSSPVYSTDGKILKEFATEKRVLVTLEKLPKNLIDALLSTEDKSFYNHWGMNIKRTMVAGVKNVVFSNSSAGGASTITQQLARTLHLSMERKLDRKIKELIIAIEIERAYTKDEILEMYFNSVFWGHGCRGIQSASSYYFGKKASDLELDETAMLIGLLPSPSNYSPYNNYKVAISRRNIVLRNMVREEVISKLEYVNALAEETNTMQQKDIGIAPYFTEEIRQEIASNQNFDIHRDGIKIYSTLNSVMQKNAEKAYYEQLEVLQKKLDRNLLNNRVLLRQLYHKYFPNGESDFVSNDSLLSLLPLKAKTVQGALIALDPSDGAILAMVGGKDFVTSKFNRAVQAKRQPGSTFKPIVYTAAIDNGYSPATQLLNQPVAIRQSDGSMWTPQNFGKSTGGLTTLREGLQHSINLISIGIVTELVTPIVVRNYAKRMGITTYLPAYESIALGAGDVLVKDIVSAYAIFPNKGVWNKPYMIKKILDREGNEVYKSPKISQEVLSKETAYIMLDMLGTVINKGTGGRARWMYNFYQPAGGKTGTTNDNTDAWFIGFTKDIVAGVWVGVDDPSVSLGESMTGAKAALPIWANFMKTTYDDLNLKTKYFERPKGVREFRICSDTKKLPTEFCPVETEIFNVKYAPKTKCKKHGQDAKNKHIGIDF
ncbi:MAG: PBP1A family penicillin-binding protein [Candidatus Marinimicrobia bacterium]|nr:PBP1A family penicillin-binding protein [Candidatus Neomarinimicrobiota bacterium]